MIELEKRKCEIHNCTSEFKVMKNSKQITCSMYCLEKISLKHRRARSSFGSETSLKSLNEKLRRSRIISKDFD